jgi:hypothetical protein
LQRPDLPIVLRLCLCRTNHQLATAPPDCALLLMFAVLQVGRRCVSQQPSCLAFVDLSNPHVLRLPWLTLTCLSRQFFHVRILALPEFRYCMPRSCSRVSRDAGYVNMSTCRRYVTTRQPLGLAAIFIEKSAPGLAIMILSNPASCCCSAEVCSHCDVLIQHVQCNSTASFLVQPLVTSDQTPSTLQGWQ